MEVWQEVVVDTHPGFGRLLAKLHASLGGGPAGLAMVAGLARANEVLPGVRAAAVAGDDVVDGQIASDLSAVGARPVVAGEDLLAREAQTRPRAADVLDEANDRGELHGTGSGVKKGRGTFNDLGLTAQHQNYRSSHVAYIERFVILIKDKHCSRLHVSYPSCPG